MSLRMKDSYKQRVIEYYQYCQDQYRAFWKLDECRAMHMGYWDVFTFTFEEALIKLNQVLIERLDIKSSDRVLDAGCGVGGSAIYLAETIGCQVVGITLNNHQVKQAQQYVLDKKVHPLPEFCTMDFTNTDFSNESFDIVWAIESVCHEKYKKAFIEEAFRILKPGGKLILADYFLGKKHPQQVDEQLLEAFSHSWGAMFLEKSDYFGNLLHQQGFKAIDYRDVTNHIMPSIERLFYLSMNNPMSLLSADQADKPEFNYQLENANSAHTIFHSFLIDLIEYGILYAEKKGT